MGSLVPCKDGIIIICVLGYVCTYVLYGRYIYIVFCLHVCQRPTILLRVPHRTATESSSGSKLNFLVATFSSRSSFSWKHHDDVPLPCVCVCVVLLPLPTCLVNAESLLYARKIIMKQSNMMSTTRLLFLMGMLACVAPPTSAFVPQRPAVPKAAFRPSSLVYTATAVNGESTATTTTNGANSSEENSSNAPPTTDIRLNIYEKARTVTSVCTSGTLCTLAVREGIQGAPFGSYVDYVLDDEGNPILLMNDMSMHTINIQQTTETSGAPAVVTLFTQRESSGEGQDVSRCSLTGVLERMDSQTTPDMDQIRMRYSLTHAYADQVMDSPKFAFYRLKPSHIYFVGGFGVLAKWMDPADYAAASPDILAASADEIIDKINGQHSEDMQLTAQHLLGVTTPIETIRMTNVDRLGMDIRVTSQMGSRRNKLQTDEFRIGFRIPVLSVEDAKSEILKVFQEAWEKANDFSWGDEEPGSSVPVLKIAADDLE